MPNTRLSIVLSNFNHASFLEKRLLSLLEQMGGQDELLIADDASTDQSCEIIEKIASQDTRIRFIKNSCNLGVIKSVNHLIVKSRGNYLCSLSADDKIEKGFIEKTMLVLEKNPEIGLCCSDCAMWFEGFPDKDPKTIYTTHLIKGVQGVQVYRPHEIIPLFRSTPFWIPGHTTIMKRALAIQYGMLREKLGYLCDWFLVHTIALKTGLAYIPEGLSLWRQDNTSFSKKTLGNKTHENEIQRNLFKESIKENETEIRELFKQTGLLHFYIQKQFFWLIFRPRYWEFLTLRALKFSFIYTIKTPLRYIKNKVPLVKFLYHKMVRLNEIG